MRYDYTIKQISNGWLVLMEEPDQNGTQSTYFADKFDAMQHVAKRLVDLTTKTLEEQKNEKTKGGQDNA